jgi:hypothetical protein
MKIHLLPMVTILVMALAESGMSVATATESMLDYLPDGKMKFPAGYREWIFLSSGLDMSYGKKSAIPGHSMFDNVFVDPEAYREFARTGTWPDHTILVMETRRGAQSDSRGGRMLCLPSATRGSRHDLRAVLSHVVRRCGA